MKKTCGTRTGCKQWVTEYITAKRTIADRHSSVFMQAVAAAKEQMAYFLGLITFRNTRESLKEHLLFRNISISISMFDDNCDSYVGSHIR